MPIRKCTVNRPGDSNLQFAMPLGKCHLDEFFNMWFYANASVSGSYTVEQCYDTNCTDCNVISEAMNNCSTAIIQDVPITSMITASPCDAGIRGKAENGSIVLLQTQGKVCSDMHTTQFINYGPAGTFECLPYFAGYSRLTAGDDGSFTLYHLCLEGCASSCEVFATFTGIGDCIRAGDLALSLAYFDSLPTCSDHA